MDIFNNIIGSTLLACEGICETRFSVTFTHTVIEMMNSVSCISIRGHLDSKRYSKNLVGDWTAHIKGGEICLVSLTGNEMLLLLLLKVSNTAGCMWVSTQLFQQVEGDFNVFLSLR